MDDSVRPDVRDRIVFALDRLVSRTASGGIDEEETLRRVHGACEFAAPYAGYVKIGYELFTALGPKAVRAAEWHGCKVFLDLKLLDIPETIAQTVHTAAALGVEIIDVHTIFGPAVLEAAVINRGNSRIFGVTVLTHITDTWCEERFKMPVAELVVVLATDAVEAGLNGIICAAPDLAAIKGNPITAALDCLTPGIRLVGSHPNDQARIATPGAAVRAGSRYLVIGRTVTATPDPFAAWRDVVTQVGEALDELAKKTARV